MAKKKDGSDKPKKFRVRGLEITGYDHRVPENGEPFLKVHYRAEFSDILCADLGWLPLADTFKTGVIKTVMHAVSISVEPSSTELKEKYAFEYVAKKIGPFTVSGIKTGEDSPDEHVISFDTVSSVTDATLGKLKSWCSKIGRAPARMDGTYVEKQPELKTVDDAQQNLLEDEGAEAEEAAEKAAVGE